MTINLSDNSPRVIYTVAAGVTQSSFTVPFDFFEEGDVNVYVDGVLKTITTDYTVSGGSGTGGTVTMSVTGISGGSSVVLTRDLTLERTTDFPTSGPFDVTSLNTELDRFTAVSADLKDQVDRALQLTDYDADANLTLPDLNSRKGKVLAFDAVTGDLVNGPSTAGVTTVAAAAADIATLADIQDGTVATDAITDTAAIKTDVTTVAGIAANVTTVAGNNANVTTVANINADVTTVAGNNANVTTVAGISGNVTTAAGISTDITAVAADATDIGTVSTNIANVNTVAGISADVTTVAADGTDIGVVAGISSDVTTVSGIAANVTSVAGNTSNINAVAADATDIGTVATNIANVNTVAGIDADVTTVAGIAADVTAAATNVADIQAISTAIADVITVANDLNEATSEIDVVANNIANVNAVGTDIANVNTVASNLADVNAFADTYFISATAPSSPTQGDLWFDTDPAALLMKVYDGSGWVNAGSSVNGTSQRVTYTATAGQTTFAATYDAGFVDVYLNGIKLIDGTDFTATSGTSIVLASGAALNDTVDIVAYGTFTLLSTVLDDLSDVSTAGATSGQVLSYNGASWSASTPSVPTLSSLGIANHDNLTVDASGNVTVSGTFTSQGIDDNATSTAMTLDTSGNLLVGKTASNVSAEGAEIRSSGFTGLTVDGGAGLTIRRLTSDGELQSFFKDTTKVGQIGTTGGGALLHIGLREDGTNPVGLGGSGSDTGTVMPVTTAGAERDAAISLGKSAARFKDLYLSGGVYLGGTGSANKLDDYEEGTFTPTLYHNSTNNSTFSSANGEYTRIGNTVTVQIRIDGGTSGTAGSFLVIGGLPFVVAQAHNNMGIGVWGSNPNQQVGNIHGFNPPRVFKGGQDVTTQMTFFTAMLVYKTS